jgi:hypothetical protein
MLKEPMAAKKKLHFILIFFLTTIDAHVMMPSKASVHDALHMEVADTYR